MSLRINVLAAGLSTRACRSTAGSIPARWPSSSASAVATAGLPTLGTPGRIAEPGAGHVHHDRGVPAGSSVEENCPEVLGGCDVDLFWRRHHGHAVDHQGMSDAGHVGPPPARDADLAPRDWPGVHLGGTAGLRLLLLRPRAVGP